MNEIEKGIAAALEVGFTHAVRLDVKTLTLLPEVRKMCAANSCGKYDRNWSCPPGCGTLEDCRRKVRRVEKSTASERKKQAFSLLCPTLLKQRQHKL